MGDIRNEVKKRDDYTCQKYGYRNTDTSRLHAHHIHPSWAGGSDEPENLITLCKQCHRFAPECESEEKSYRLMSAFLSTEIRPEYDLVVFGLQAAAAQEESLDQNQVDILMEAIRAGAEGNRECDGRQEPRESHIYWSQMYSFARKQLSRGDRAEELYPEIADRFSHVE